ncbi:hypothetical protein [Streptomyces roseolilacinus]|uniref:Lipoprotein n=1 Tax=Streptomyces roseolilacinus TaxID=66904 RepID=A0A918B3X0_9ACTN|nr:hypothetical protein [Streptomyces roseolilacinus]GGQ09741.1 hypothetical protein GCM10010249_30430 [Streptomyces roseolilacinus]
MQCSRRAVRGIVCAASVVAVAGLMSGCSSDDPARAEEWQRVYCTRLGSWQDARDALTVSTGDAGADDARAARSPEFRDAENAAHAAVAASKVLDREGLDHTGGHLVEDTVWAVGGDTEAEGRATSYCSGSGFETLVG